MLHASFTIPYKNHCYIVSCLIRIIEKLYLKLLLYGIIIMVVNLPGGFHLRKGVVIVNTYEEFMVIINAAALIVTILTYVKHSDKGTKK